MNENTPKGSVMVVGAGIAGIQASLDLADSGYLVYLVEKDSAIGGVMSQLDKTFPTNDCSMCIISPKLVECGRHLNIELLTMTEVVEVNGKPGDFKVKLLERPRYIDLEKCTACGECAKACPIEVPNMFDQGLRDRQAAYKLYPQAMPSAFAIEKKGTAPCKATCPAHISVQGYVALVARGKYREALELIKEQNPLPAICGRVCHHPCETVCTRGQVDQPVAIDFIKRFVADLDLDSETRYVPEIREKKEDKVAIIGAGPAGLSCAYYLAIEGYRVTIYEKLPVAGGMLAVGIPEYRLSRDVLNAEIQVIRDMGVEIRTGVEIGADVTVDQLRKEGNRAIFLGVGAQECKVLGIEGEELEGVYPGVEFLRDVNLGKEVHLGNRVAVIGGGNVAMDSVRTARRIGAKEAFIIYRRSFDEMPANEEEIEECKEEGIQIHTLTNPTRIIAEDGRVKAIECVKMMLGEPDESGRRRPLPVEGSEFRIELDGVIPAIGQESDWSCLGPECACTLTDWGTMNVDPLTLQTDDPDIFAGGDAVTGPRTVIEAIEAGKQAALSIDRLIRGVDLREGREKEWEAVKDVPTRGYDLIPREQMPRIPPDDREGNFQEVQLGFAEEQAVAEAKRCLACGICSECYQCVPACLAGAVDHDMIPRERTVAVGGIVLAPGFAPFDPTQYETYAYAEHPNVVTSIEFERILSASGPFEGHLVRPSDHKEPEKIAWLQCVGSRDINRCDHAYCSAVCCMYAIKEAVIAKEHSDKALDAAVFYMDMRTYGKDFEKYYNRAKDESGVRFIRSRIHSIQPAENGDLTIQYADESGRIHEETFDMVVLSVGLAPVQGVTELAERFGIELNAHQYVETTSFAPVSTSREGVYVCGVFQGPKDIPQSVMEASASAAASTQALAEARGALIRTKELPPELDVSDQRPRIGVFVCNCGINIGGIADVPAVRDYASTLPDVVYVEDNLFTCSQDTQDKMKEVIRENHINRVVVASCSPRTHAPLFQETIREVGLNKYLFEMANIRDQNTWVHMNDPEQATEKAKDLVRMAIAKASLVEPLQQIMLEVRPAALIVGGGVAGMEAALGVAEQGFQAYLVEKTKELGGVARRLRTTWRGEEIGAYLKDLIGRVEKHPKIRLFLETEIKDTSGVIGNFTTTLAPANAQGPLSVVEHGAAILATGGREYRPTEFLYGQHPNVLTHLDLDEAILKGDDRIKKAKTAVFIQCVGSRIPERPYCSKICCSHSLESALTLKELNPDLDAFILYRDLRSYGFKEDLYRKAREKGVIFVRYDLDQLPVVEVGEQQRLSLTVTDHVLGRPIKLSPDFVVLAAAILPNENKDLFELFKVPVNPEGFLIEAHMKLRPVDFSSEGLFMAGLAHYPKPIDETITQAKAAVARSMTILSKEGIFVGGVVASVNPDHCAACLTCVRTCPYGAPGIGEEGYAVIDPAACRGCGACVAECPGKAITLKHFTDEQIIAKTDALFEARSS
jgi:heterodisulfide reductase subunit A-like polyferredoxin